MIITTLYNAAENLSILPTSILRLIFSNAFYRTLNFNITLI